MLLTNSAKRLSIDIDIIISENRRDLDEIFETFVRQQGFNKVEMQHRTRSSSITKAHYKFFYTPVHKTRSHSLFCDQNCLNGIAIFLLRKSLQRGLFYLN